MTRYNLYIDVYFPFFMSSLLKTVVSDSHLTLHYRLGLADGSDIVSTFGAQPATFLLGESQLLPALEQALLGMQEGQSCRLTLEAREAFGERNPELLQYVSWDLVATHTKEDESFEIGDWVEFNPPKGGRMVGQLKSKTADQALFDFNHPLAGLDLLFEAQIIAIL